MQSQKQPDDKALSFSDSFNILYWGCNIVSMSVLPFFRTSMGSHVFGKDAFLAMFFMLIVGGTAKAPEMNYFILVFLAVTVLHRARGFWRRWRRREVIHSRYLGDPWLARLPRVSPKLARTILEPLATFAIGALIQDLSSTVGQYLMVAAAALFVKNLIDSEMDRSRVRRMRDAHIEQSYLLHRYREGD